MTIKEVEEKLNISRAYIRYYEKEGLLEPKGMIMNIEITAMMIFKDWKKYYYLKMQCFNRKHLLNF